MAKATAKAAAKAHRLYIDGKWVTGKETLPVIDKYTGEAFATVPVLFEQESLVGFAAAAHDPASYIHG